MPQRADRSDLEVMARYCQEYSPKLFVSMSVFHNPIVFCLSPSSAYRILQLPLSYGGTFAAEPVT